MKKTIYNVYVKMESQEQCDRMKQVCVDNGLPIWKDKSNPKYPFLFEENSDSVFEYSYREFGIWHGGGCNLYTQATESEFLELLKTTK